MAVIVTKGGKEKRFEKGVSVTHDGHGDLQILDADGKIIGTRQRPYGEVDVEDN